MRDERVEVPASPFAAMLMAAARQPGPEQTIGVATQEPDGTIVLHLRASSDGGAMGDALVRYPPRDPHHAAVAKHVGPIPKGGIGAGDAFRGWTGMRGFMRSAIGYDTDWRGRAAA